MEVTINHHHGHHLLPEHRLALLHGAHTHDVKPRRWNLVQAASDAVHGHDGKVLVVVAARTCVRSLASLLASAELTLPVQCEALVRQGLGCLDKLCTRHPRADPRVHLRTFSHVLPPHALSRAARGLRVPSPTLRKTPPPPSTVRGGQ